MSESASLKNLTDQLNEERYPNGVCPFMSTVRFVPMAVSEFAVTGPSRNASIPGQGVPVPVPGLAPCLGEKCQLWDKLSFECCYRFQVRVISELSEFLSDVSGAVKRIESHVEEIADIYEQTHPI